MTESIARIIYFSFLGLAGITLLVGLDVIGRTPEIHFGFLIGFISVSAFLCTIGWTARHLIGGSGSIGSKLDTLKWIALRRWGMLFRTLFISFLGIAAYFWMEPQNIGDVPFSELTLNQIFKNLFAFLMVGGCICWFFKFPDERNSMVEEPNDNPYVFWGRLSILVALIVTVIAFLYAAWLM